MKKINICIKTKDLEYGSALSKSLQLNCNLYSIQMESDRQETMNESLERREYDILLTDDMTETAHKTVILAEDPFLELVDPASKRFIVYKYQFAGNISSVLRLAYSAFSQTEMLSDETTQANIISICASSGGVGCTSIALGICQELIRFHGKKVLYINLEEFESATSYFPLRSQETINISRYLYSILHKKNAEKLAIGGCIMQDEYGVSTFVPSKGRNPLRELEGRDFIKFINHVTQELPCSELVLDCGTGLDATIVAALELSTQVCHVSGRNKNENRKDAYLRIVSHRLGQSELLEMIEVLNFYDEPAPDSEEFDQQVDKNVIIIEDDPVSLTELNDHRFISLDKNFGLGIRQIADRLTSHEG